MWGEEEPGRITDRPLSILGVVSLPRAKTDPLRYETKEWTPFLRAVELPYVHHHWPPARCHLLQAALAAREIKLGSPLQERRAP